MTEHTTTPDSGERDPREQYEAGRDAFGAALVNAARAQERGTAPSSARSRSAFGAPRSARPRRRRRGLAVGGSLALAGGLATLAIGIPSPGDSGDPNDPTAPGGGRTLIGASSAVAAVSAIRDALHTGVLVRDYVTSGSFDGESRTQDWTDLATRDQHMKIARGDGGTLEYWNPSAHERWQVEDSIFRAKDGRAVVSHITDKGAENSSASQSPTEEVDQLLKDAQAGKVTIRKGGRPGERVLTMNQQCYATPNDGAGECPDPEADDGGGWPNQAPKGMRPVLSFQRWWITDDEQPQVIRYDNGNTAPDGTDRRVVFRMAYRTWKVLPRNADTLALVRPPTFDPSKYLVVTGGAGAVSDAVRRGEITCTSPKPGYCGR